ncbi:MAG: metallophosphatase family protein [Candidatus Saccharicenans sp.]|jgi:putative phosphoesterase|nr:metallophosphatase family protein [Candidatus Saccharicenans sp.]MDH7493960.1 metallophosphoesterase family protein [Candidatus Saccharicenans sp.]
MRYLIFSDIHGNLEALEAVLENTSRKKIDYYIFLGDLVGYGASPNEVLQKVTSLKHLIMVRGNHDKAVCGLDSIQTFNPIAAAAIQWTRKTLIKKYMSLLSSLAKGPLVIHKNITICHGSPFDEDYYIFGEFDAVEAFGYFDTPLCFFGHTHFPFIYVERDQTVEGTFIQENPFEIKLEKGVRYLINPGSVGQPRDRNPRAAYAIYDSEQRRIKFYRVDYDLKESQKKILAASLPSALAERLGLGI